MNVNKKGFTLIELLVVVAIIGVLAGIVLVSLNSARTKADKSSLQSTLASVMPVASMCLNEGYNISTATAGNAICVDDDGVAVSDITELWPTLPTALSAKKYAYSYSATGGTDGAHGILGTLDGETIITCTVSTGSCQ
ncbi:MAG: type II secretion system protein [Candidatus Moranbacteria bacterium]|nr:type II secretion system protein [Candidatus Moranbacteria bacterium]